MVHTLILRYNPCVKGIEHISRRDMITFAQWFSNPYNLVCIINLNDCNGRLDIDVRLH